MGTIAEKLTYLNETKSLIKDNLNKLGADLTDEDEFREYSNKVDELYNRWPRTTGEGEIVNLKTIKAPMEIGLKGNTTQNGTPTPSSPQNVNVVKGKNLYDIGQPSDYVASSGATSAVVQSTTNDVLSVKIINYGGTYCYNSKTNYMGGKTYTITAISSKTFARAYIRLRKLDGSDWMTNSDTTISGWEYNSVYKGWFKFSSQTTMSFTIAIPNCAYFQIGFGYTNGENVKVGDIETISKIQVEENSTATPYLPYNTIQVEVAGKTLFDLSSMIGTTQAGVTLTQDTNGKFELNGTATNTGRWRVELSQDINYPVTLYLKAQDNNGNIMLSLRNSSATQLVAMKNTATTMISNYTPTSPVHYIEIAQIGTSASYTNYKFEVMVVKGTYNSSTIGEYEPYKSNNYPLTLGDIELCKIGTYQDKIYKNNEKWYLEKQVGKVTYTGASSESWSSDGPGRYKISLATSLGETVRNMIYSNYFHFSTGIEVGTGFNYNKLIMLYPETSVTTADAFKTWLSTHNTIVYYALATPTTTEITDETLLEQLEELETAKSYEGTTNVVGEGNLPPILNVSALLGN